VHGGFNTPSLLGLARSAPYLHSGAASTLKERITVGKERDLHGKTAQLSEAEVDDLVEYLKSL
jgi:cytochrome c peroxidase